MADRRHLIQFAAAGLAARRIARAETCPALDSSFPDDPFKSLDPIIMAVTSQVTFAVHPSLPAKPANGRRSFAPPASKASEDAVSR